MKILNYIQRRQDDMARMIRQAGVARLILQAIAEHMGKIHL